EFAGDELGYAVGISDDGKRIAAAAPFNDENGNSAGKVRVYELVGGTWTQIGDDLKGTTAGDLLGHSCALSANGNRMVVSAVGNDATANEAGQVTVFELLNDEWVRVGQPINGFNERDRFGWSVSLADDGHRFAASAIFSDPNGVNSGQAYLYEFAGGTWSLQGHPIDGATAGDGLGRSVSLSGDGSMLAVGSPFTDTVGTNTGRVSVYSFTAALPVELRSFRGEIRDKHNRLTWETATEDDFSHFVVERSLDALHWSQVGEVMGDQRGTYYFEEEAITAYYRLKMIDLDGTFTYSELVFLENSLGGAAGAMKVYPNPSNGRFTVDLTEVELSAGGGGELRLVDGTGRLVWSATVPAGQRELRVDASNSLSGMFILAYIEDDAVVSHRLWIQ
ncbi:MAG: T9SS type A sorting domain-containing protein, partial [Bacteroidota bacterium]